MRRYDLDIAVLSAVTVLRRGGTYPTAAQIAKRLHVTPRAVNYAMVRLVALGAVRRYVDDGAHGRGWRYLYDVSLKAAYMAYCGEEPAKAELVRFAEGLREHEQLYRLDASRHALRRLTREGRDSE